MLFTVMMQITYVEIGPVVQKANRNAYNQGLGFPEFLLVIVTQMIIAVLLRYRCDFHFCQ